MEFKKMLFGVKAIDKYLQDKFEIILVNDLKDAKQKGINPDHIFKSYEEAENKANELVEIAKEAEARWKYMF